MSPPPRRARSRVATDDRFLVGVDTGGTFTDIVAIAGGVLRTYKVLSTPRDPAAAVIEGVRALLDGDAPDALTYSSTVATNALLERKGARVALFTNAGFEDLIEIGRQNRLELYSLYPARPLPLIARALRIGVRERTNFDGTVVQPLARAELKRAARRAMRSRAESLAIALLHSYANPKSENALMRALAPLRRPLTVSHRILSEYREFERCSTAVVNAYVAPRMSSHLRNVSRRLAGTRLRVMQSNGSAISLDVAEREPVRTLLSGPAAGVIGAAALTHSFGTDRFITFDMGGTSTDVSLFNRRARIRTLSYPGGYAVRTPTIDIHTVGAGGGSIARVDAGGSLRVGPQSAGADPGPACYGRGDAPTVTDADLIGGRLVAESFLGGRMKLDVGRAARALGRLARAMKVGGDDAALGVIRVVNANMERAIRVITVERGFDPRDFALLAFGGAGPMHAAELARGLGIAHVILPRNPGLLCAYGALGAPLGREYSLTVREPARDWRALAQRARPLFRRARRELVADGADASAITHTLWADMRYRGQSYELEVRVTPDFIRAFHEAHRRAFGHATPDAPVEVVNLRLRASAGEARVAPGHIRRSRRSLAALKRAPVLVDGRRRAVPVYERDSLGAGVRLRGPAVIVEMSATAYVAPEFTLRVDDFGNLHLETPR